MDAYSKIDLGWGRGTLNRWRCLFQNSEERQSRLLKNNKNFEKNLLEVLQLTVQENQNFFPVYL